jgi:hypothetical protein
MFDVPKAVESVSNAIKVDYSLPIPEETEELDGEIPNDEVGDTTTTDTTTV